MSRSTGTSGTSGPGRPGAPREVSAGAPASIQRDALEYGSSQVTAPMRPMDRPRPSTNPQLSASSRPKDELSRGLTVGGELDRLSSTTMTLETVLRHAIRRAPCTIRALARAAGVSHTMLAAIEKGKERATPRVALEVARALETWGTRCHSEAAKVRTAIAGLKPRRRS